MAREKVTLTLDTENLAELRRLVGARSISAAVNSAIQAYLARLRHLEAVDQWLVDMERDHGPIPPQTLDWAEKLVRSWETERTRRTRRAG